jgi:hypothetical protein
MEVLNMPELKTHDMCKPDDVPAITIPQHNVDKVMLFIRINKIKAKQVGISGITASAKATAAEWVLKVLGLTV